MHNTPHPNRSMTPELHITSSHIGVIVPNRKKLLKGNNSGTSPIKKKPKVAGTQVFTPSRSKSPSDLNTMKNKKNITKSPTAATAKTKTNKITLPGKDKTLTPSKTDRTVTTKHRITNSVSREKDKINNTNKHMYHNTSISNEKTQISKTKFATQTHSKIQSSLSPSAIKKNNIKTPVVGKNKVKVIVKRPNGNNSSDDVQNSLNEINETVKELHQSLKIIDNDTEKQKDMKSFVRSRKMIEGLSDSDEDEEEQAKRNEKLKMKREKEKRIMDKLRSENDKNKNTREMSPDFNRGKEDTSNKNTRGMSPDFNTKNTQYSISSNNIQITTNQKETQSFEVIGQKKGLYQSTNYEISSNQKDNVLGITTQKRDQYLNQQSKELEIDKTKKTKIIDKDKDKTKGKKSDKYNDDINSLSSNSNDSSNNNITHDKKKTINLTEYCKENSNITIMKENDKEIEKQPDEKDSSVMKDKREKIREKVIEKRKEKEKSKEKILKDKNNASSTNDINNQNEEQSSTVTRSKNKASTLTSNINKQDDKTNPKLHLQRSILPDNRRLKSLLMTLNSGFININKKISIVTSSPQLLPVFQMRTLLLEKVSSLVKESSNIKVFLSKYDQHMFTRPFTLTKVASSSVSLITKEEELGLCKKPQAKEILNLFTAIYIILNESHYEIPTKDLVVNLVQVLLKKYQVDSIKSLLLNVLPQKINMSDSQIDLLVQIKESSPNMLSASDMAKINRAASYICFVVQEIYDYVFAQYSDGTTLNQVKKAVKDEKLLQIKIDKLQRFIK